MCGNFGIIFDTIPDPAQSLTYSKLFSMLAVLSAERGLHSTGMAHVNVNGTGQVYKDIVPSYDMVRRTEWYNELSAVDVDTLMLMGHTRHGTHGKNLVENAHPHYYVTEHGTLIGTHNGVISNHERIAPGATALENDSANLFWRLSVETPSNWTNVLEELAGSYALIWTQSGKIHIARNWGSPLFTGGIDSLGVTIYASTLHILRAAAAIAGAKLTSYKPVDTGTLFTYDKGIIEEAKFNASYIGSDYSFYGGTQKWPDTGTVTPTTNQITRQTSMFSHGVMQKCFVCKESSFISYDSRYFTNGVCDDCVEVYERINRNKIAVIPWVKKIHKYCADCNTWSLFSQERTDSRHKTCDACFQQKIVPKLITAGV